MSNFLKSYSAQIIIGILLGTIWGYHKYLKEGDIKTLAIGILFTPLISIFYAYIWRKISRKLK